MPPVTQPIFFVIGSTGSGKSKVAVHLAHELKLTYGYKHVVIINCDVYQCFTSLPIATNKPSEEELGKVPHAFLGFLDSNGTLCDENCGDDKVRAGAHRAAAKALGRKGSFSVHAYEDMVVSFLTEYLNDHEDAAVIVCGGTCYYAQALLFSNSLVSDGGTETTNERGTGRAHESNDDWDRLNEIDAEVAHRYHPNDRRRIQRLLEIYESTGRKPSEIFNNREANLRFTPSSLYIIWTSMKCEALDVVLNQRVDEMLLRGMIDEVKGFWCANNGNLPPTSISEAIGCKEYTHYFTQQSSPLISEGDTKTAVETVKASTRRYARQQVRWVQNRLLPLLQTSPLKEHWTHFVTLQTDLGGSTSTAVSKTLEVFFSNTIDGTNEALCFPLQADAPTREPVSQLKCDVCGVLVYGRGQMESHLKSKRHRGVLRRQALEKEQKELFGRDLPPPKRKRAS